MPPPVSLSKRATLSPDNLAQGLTQFPSAAAVLPRLMDVLSSTTSSIDEVVEILRLDAGVAARILRVANSAAYTRGGRCESLVDAVYKVGFLRVYEVVSITAASNLFLQPLAAYDISADAMWRRSVTTAIAAELLAERTHLNPHVAYVVGLLHGVGLTAIDQWAKSEALFPILASQGYPKETTANELAVIGFTNASAADAVLRSWGFPDNLVEPIRCQYEPRLSSMRNHAMACLLGVAKWVRQAAQLGEDQPRMAEPERWTLQLLHLAPGDLIGIAMATRQAFDQTLHRLDQSERTTEPMQAEAATSY